MNRISVSFNVLIVQLERRHDFNLIISHYSAAPLPADNTYTDNSISVIVTLKLHPNNIHLQNTENNYIESLDQN